MTNSKNKTELSRDFLQQEVINIAGEMLGILPHRIDPQDSLVNELGADSLNKMEFVLMLEDYFGIKVPNKVMEQCESCKDFADWLYGRQAQIKINYSGGI